MTATLADVLRRFKRPALFSHIHPDGDAIGSQVALWLWFTRQGIDACMFNDDPVPEHMSWIAGSDQIRVPDEELLAVCDCFVLIDGNHPARFGAMRPLLEAAGKPLFLIDHHLDAPVELFEGMLWSPEASSTAWLVYTLVRDTAPDLIDADMASALYAGIVTDTGSFRFESVTAETHLAVADLVQRGGIRPFEIHERIYDNRSVSQYHLLGTMLQGIELHAQGRVAVAAVSDEDMKRYGCDKEDLEGFVNYGLAIKGVLVSMLLYEREDRIKVSLRGKSVADLNTLARKFNGGGHFNAAGAWHDGPREKAVQELVAEVVMALDGANV